ncbi:DUF932 domain-containing protein [Streptomyces kronopolitis]|uniref:DUF932 domain-containing protein n=1 Tax=Streptomyces kronopolitis TaxID=1612435 RepID=UPI0036C59ED5
MAQNITTTPQPVSSTRNAELSDLAELLKEQHSRKVDMVAPASALTAVQGNLLVQGVDPEISTDGVTLRSGLYRPTPVADEGISQRLNIPIKYLRRMRAEMVDLYDLNVEGWLKQEPERQFLLRTFRGEGEKPGVLRAFLSDRYRRIDNFDVLTAALKGIQDAAHSVKISGCDLTDRRMMVRVESEDIKVHAPELLKGYRSPFTGQTGDELPIVSAGFVIANSEVGAGAFTITPRIVVEVCRNGMTMAEDVVQNIHLGGRLESGVIRWSEDTENKNLELITARTRDAVATFMDRAYVETKLRAIEKDAGREIKDVTKTIEVVGKRLKFTDSVRESVLGHFIQGGQTTAGGVMQAITATAQTLTDADTAYELEAQAIPAMAMAARL